MKIAEVSARPPQLVQQLVEVWQRSVQATHLFLSAPEIAAIRTYVPQALCGVEHLIVAQDESGTPVGFMGVQENRLEMLFLDPEARGQGLGARLLCLGMEQYGVSELTVNEQNPEAAGFYRHMGFAAYRRSELDEQGGPYPILYMRRGVKHCSALPYGARAKILSILMACRPVSCYTVLYIYKWKGRELSCISKAIKCWKCGSCL